MTTLDWLFVLWYFVVALSVGLYYSRRATRSIADFFLSGRALPWWVVGTSMVATTFSSDTPLTVSGFVAKNGISQNWIWWAFVLNGTMTAFIFAHLWRRTGLLTDVEFAELRYGGKPAAFLRGFRAIYFGVLMNALIIGWVSLAMTKILAVVAPGWTKGEALLICMSVVVIYSILAGFWGVVSTDLLQFTMAMVGAVALAIFAVQGVGGIRMLKAQLLISGKGALLNLFPPTPTIPLMAFVVYLFVQWWAVWYPGSEPGGGGYIAQRILSSRTERDATLATLWFNLAHYAVRPWPWILVGLCIPVVFPGLKDTEMGYPMAMMKFLPVGLRGLMLASFFAALMSTLDTHFNWGASYLVNDLYKRFVKPEAPPKHYVKVSQLITLFLALISAGVAMELRTMKEAWELIIALGAGTGLVYNLRWFWWRVNAWSEISAMAASFVVALTLGRLMPGDGMWPYRVLLTVGITTAIWLSVTFLTSPERREVLVNFYRKVRPGGFWGPVREEAPEVKPERMGGRVLLWLLAATLVYCAIFGVGAFILGYAFDGAVLFVIVLLSAIAIARL
ncbi:MAG TPA: sodium:proline symporter, partial [Armatimonadetes bacterium]|nr:sodium:proline symporter [Armatimonadota bacterium]